MLHNDFFMQFGTLSIICTSYKAKTVHAGVTQGPRLFLFILKTPAIMLFATKVGALNKQSCHFTSV